MSAVIPYLSVHMRSIGLSLEEIGTISAFLPFAAFIGPTLAGMISDKLGEYRYVLIMAMVATAASQTLLLATDANIPDGFESCNATATLHMRENGTLVELSDFSPHSNSSLEMVRFSLPNGTCCIKAESCLPDKLFIFEVENDQENLTTMFGRVREMEDDMSCSEAEVTIDAVRTVDPERDELYKKKHMKGFWLHFLVRAFYTVTASTCFCMLDAIVLAMVKEHNGDYGKQRLFSMLGLGVSSPIAGIFVDWLSEIRGFRDYSVMFYFSDALLLLACVLVWRLNVKAPKSEGSFFKNLGKLISIPEIPVFLFFMFLLGNNWGCLENYLFIYLLDLNAPNYLLGLTITVGCFCGLPFLFIAKEVIAKVGVINMLVVSYFTYTVRLIGYSLIQDPWMSLPFEAMEFLTYHALQCTACTFCADKAPKGLLATLTAVFGSAHYQLGRGSGAFIGGLLIPSFGIRETYRIFAYASAIIGCSYWLIHNLILKKIEKRREKGRASYQVNGEVSVPFIHKS